MGHAKFNEEDFYAAALAIAAGQGLAAVTVASISARLKSPTGSFYHRFVSLEVLLGELWLRAVLDFQTGMAVARDAGDALAAALHTPAWARNNLDQARLLLLYDRRDFVAGEWPEPLRARVAEMTKRMEAASPRWARMIFGKDGREEVRLAQFLISELPVAVVRQHLVRGEKPPPLVDDIIRTTYAAILADYQSRKAPPRGLRRQKPV
jgi:AcrR family transcriptional regulator